ncbi:hypothetical protein K435DRAFT_602580, partial [Dendrothele bispora CBS 962.96]
LGKEEDHEVYEGECVGLILALHLLQQEQEVSTVSIWVDNTAAIMAAGSNRNGPAHYLLDLFHTQLLAVRNAHPNLTINISWVPGHRGIHGNERADEEAKRATKRSSPRRLLPAALQ